MFRSTFGWRTSSLIALLASLTTVTACNQDITPEDEGHLARLRIINSVYQGADAATAVPVSIDVLIDESISAPGAVSALAPNSMTTGTAGFPKGSPSQAGYTEMSEDIHTFLARVTGTANSLYTNNESHYVPTIYVTPLPHTLLIAGIAPPSGTPPRCPACPPGLAPMGAFPFIFPVDDQFEPVSGGARVQVINAAPFASASGEGAEIEATFSGAGTFTATAGYRGSSDYLDPPAGTYTLTVTADGTMLWTGTVSLGPGEVRSFIVQSTAYSMTPGVGNTKVTNVLDNQW